MSVSLYLAFIQTMTKYKFDFEKQRKIAQKSIREMKEVMPFIFPERHRLQQANKALEEAKKEAEAALRAWNSLGGN